MSTVIEQDHIVPRSSLRYRPLPSASTTIDVAPPKARASRARDKREPHTTGGPPFVVTRKGMGHWMVPLILAMLGTVVLLWLFQMVWAWGQTVVNDVRYGRPRTMQVDAFVGHEAGKVPSHFIATNLHGRAYILELPGGDPSKAKIYVGPQLTGEGADLIPVTLRFVERPNDHVSDMIVQFGEIEVRYQNEKGTFVPQ